MSNYTTFSTLRVFCNLSVSVGLLASCSAIEGVTSYVVGDSQSARSQTASQIASTADATNNIGGAAMQAAASNVQNRLSSDIASGIDSRIPNSSTDLTITGIEKRQGGMVELTNVTGFGSTENKSQKFVQSSLTSGETGTTVNVGLGQRFLNEDETLIYGLNVFLDQNVEYGHSRASVGGEIKSSGFEITANKYVGLTGWKSGKSSVQEKALDGYDIEIGGQIPFVPSAKLFAKSSSWGPNSSSQKTELSTYSLRVDQPMGNGFAIEAGVRDYKDTATKDEAFASLTFKKVFGQKASTEKRPFISDVAYEAKSMRAHMLDKVRRQNEIVVEKKFSVLAGGI